MLRVRQVGVDRTRSHSSVFRIRVRLVGKRSSIAKVHFHFSNRIHVKPTSTHAILRRRLLRLLLLRLLRLLRLLVICRQVILCLRSVEITLRIVLAQQVLIGQAGDSRCRALASEESALTRGIHTIRWIVRSIIAVGIFEMLQ